MPTATSAGAFPPSAASLFPPCPPSPFSSLFLRSRLPPSSHSRHACNCIRYRHHRRHHSHHHHHHHHNHHYLCGRQLLLLLLFLSILLMKRKVGEVTLRYWIMACWRLSSSSEQNCLPCSHEGRSRTTELFSAGCRWNKFDSSFLNRAIDEDPDGYRKGSYVPQNDVARAAASTPFAFLPSSFPPAPPLGPMPSTGASGPRLGLCLKHSDFLSNLWL